MNFKKRKQKTDKWDLMSDSENTSISKKKHLLFNILFRQVKFPKKNISFSFGSRDFDTFEMKN